MRHDQLTSLGRTHSFRSVALLAALVAGMVFYAGCDKQQQPTSDANKAIPCPSPTPVQDGDMSDTPIVISGGSVQLEFSHKLFSGRAGEYTIAGNTLTNDSTIYDNSPGNPKPDIHLPIPANGKCTIILKGKEPGSGGMPVPLITVESRDSPKSVTIRFDETAFPRRSPKSNLHTHRGHLIEEIVVRDDNAGGATTTYSQPSQLPANGKVTVELFGMR